MLVSVLLDARDLEARFAGRRTALCRGAIQTAVPVLFALTVRRRAPLYCTLGHNARLRAILKVAVFFHAHVFVNRILHEKRTRSERFAAKGSCKSRQTGRGRAIVAVAQRKMKLCMF